MIINKEFSLKAKQVNQFHGDIWLMVHDVLTGYLLLKVVLLRYAEASGTTIAM
jgi:hypothetical protein